jgi:hypothetical protein
MTPATSMVPSLEDARQCQARFDSRGVTPESLEVYICPLCTAATNLTPSLEDATAIQLRLESRAVQVVPESAEV